jgi:hypothetical protein
MGQGSEFKGSTFRGSAGGGFGVRIERVETRAGQKLNTET